VLGYLRTSDRTFRLHSFEWSDYSQWRINYIVPEDGRCPI